MSCLSGVIFIRLWRPSESLFCTIGKYQPQKPKCSHLLLRHPLPRSGLEMLTHSPALPLLQSGQTVVPLLVHAKLWLTLPLPNSLHEEIIIIPSSQLFFMHPGMLRVTKLLKVVVQSSLSNQWGPPHPSAALLTNGRLASAEWSVSTLSHGSLFCFPTVQSW